MQHQHQHQQQMADQLLARSKALADALSGQSMTGPDLLDCICHLNAQYTRHQIRVSESRQSMDAMVRLTEQWFTRCVQIYTEISLRVYDMLGGLDGDAAVRPNRAMTQATVDIDPACALSLIQAGPVIATLYNDNATLAKWAPSELLPLPNAEAECEALEEYFDEQASAVEEYQLVYEALLRQYGSAGGKNHVHSLELQQQVSRCIEAVRNLALPPQDESIHAITVALEMLQGVLTQQDEHRCRESKNSEEMIDNVCAKFLECARLKEKLLNSYYIERARQRRVTHLAPHF